MKKSRLFIVCIIILSSGPLSGQLFVENYRKLLNHFRDTVVSLTSNDNCLVSGIENRIFVNQKLFQKAVNVSSDPKYILTVEGETIIMKAPSPDTRESNFILVTNIQGDTLLFRTFRTENLPAPQVYFGHVNLSESRKLWAIDIRQEDSIYIFFRPGLTGSMDWLKVKRFTFGYNYGSYHLSYDNIGPYITSKTREKMLGLKPGQEVSLSILAEGSGSMKKEVPLVYFRIQ